MAIQIKGSTIINDSGESSSAQSKVVVNQSMEFKPFLFQGETSGYSSGGEPGLVNTIDKFPFSADGNATDVCDLTQERYGLTGQQI